MITHQSPSSCKLKSLIAQLGRYAQRAVADNVEGVEMIKNLYSEAKDTSVGAEINQHHLTKPCVVTAEDVVHLQVKWEKIVTKKAVKLKKWWKTAAAKVASVSEWP